MPTRWETFPVVTDGGLITNISPLRQGIEAPGSARSLINFEPSVDGGYKRIKGFTKYDDETLAPYGAPVVQASGQSGTSLDIANISVTPVAGDTFTIAGVTGTYTIDTGGVSFSASGNSATLTLTTSLDSSPADGAAITFTNNDNVVQGVAIFDGGVIAYRGGDLWESTGSGWTKINVPSYGSPETAGGAQTGTSFNVDGLTVAPKAGDTFTVAGIEQVYTVTSNATLTGDAATLAITPALASSPSDNAALTFLSTERASNNKLRSTLHTFNNTPTIVFVDGTSLPAKWDGTTFTELEDVPTEVDNADFVEEFKNHIFLAQDNALVFSAPYSDTNYTPASGGGVINLPYRITGIKVFREQLIVFCTNQIYRIVGNTVADFSLQPISKNIGCTKEDTIQEIGGDLMFVAPDGVRFLSATDRLGDFGLAVASRPIQKEVEDLISMNTTFCSLVIRKKNQYRLFGYTANFDVTSSVGILGTQFADQSTQGMAWSKTQGIKANVCDSVYSSTEGEVIVFAHEDGYVYTLENGNDFDGTAIRSYYYMPYLSFNDPRIRKTMYRLTTYINTQSSIEGTATLKFDFNEENTIQPPSVIIESVVSAGSSWGSAVWGSFTWGSKPYSVFPVHVTGSGMVVSVQYEFIGGDTFSLDSVVLEYMTNDRQ